MRKILTILMGVVMAAAVSASAMAAESAPENINGATTVDAEKVIELIDETDNLVIIDARTVKDFVAGHIDGAINIVNTDVNADSLAKVLESKNSPVLFYCNGVKCGRSAVATEAAVKAGYTNVYYYYKGMGEWKEQNLPVVVGE